MSNHLQRYKGLEQFDFKLHVVAPFITTFGEEKLKALATRTDLGLPPIEIAPHSQMKSIDEEIPSDHIKATMSNMYFNTCIGPDESGTKGRTLHYFDHKVADFLSTARPAYNRFVYGSDGKTVKKQIFYLNENRPVHFLLDEVASEKGDFTLELLGPQQKGVWKAQLKMEEKIVPIELNGNTHQPLYIGFFDEEEQRDTRYQFLDLSTFLKKTEQYSLNEPLAEIIPSIYEILVVGHAVPLSRP